MPPPTPAEGPLSSPVVAWLREIEARERSATEDYPPTIRKRLILVLVSLPDPNGLGRLTIQLISVTLRHDDRFGRSGPFWRGNVARAEAGRFLRAADLWIMRRLNEANGRCALQPDSDVDVLRRMIATGRARWGCIRGPAVTKGPERPGQRAIAVAIWAIILFVRRIRPRAEPAVQLRSSGRRSKPRSTLTREPAESLACRLSENFTLN